MVIIIITVHVNTMLLGELMIEKVFEFMKQHYFNSGPYNLSEKALHSIIVLPT